MFIYVNSVHLSRQKIYFSIFILNESYFKSVQIDTKFKFQQYYIAKLSRIE